jgi:hypothetical protein
MPSPVLDLMERLRFNQLQRWLRGERPLVESYLAEHPDLYQEVDGLLDFIYAEFCMREESGEAPRPEEYLERFPEFAPRLAPLFALHRAFGPQPSTESFPADPEVDVEANRNERPLTPPAPRGLDVYPHEPVLARPIGDLERSRRWMRRPAIVAALALGAALMIALAIAIVVA